LDNLLVCVKALCISKIKYIWCLYLWPFLYQIFPF